MTSDNPFLNPDFTINWPELTADNVVPGMEAALSQGNEQLARIESIPDGEETFANTFLALEGATETVGKPWGKVGLLDSVNDHKEMRDAYREILPKVSAFFSAIPLNPKLYAKLQKFAGSEAAARLDPLEARFLDETLKDFRDSGADKDPETRGRLQEIEESLAKKTKQFSENVLDSTNQYERIVDNREDLAGLPDPFIEAARLDALKKGHGSEEEPKYRFNLQATSFIPVLRFLDNDGLRREIYEALTGIAHHGEHENEPLIREVIALRNEKATLLGKAVFPDWVLSRRMAKSGKRALGFVEDLHAKTKDAFDRENAELEAFKARKTGSEPAPLNPWEAAYWSEKLRKETYDFDEEAVRPYFPLPSVMSGLFTLVERIFGIRVAEETDPKPPVWDPAVQVFAITDVESGRHLGSFYSDWFPRESKRSGAWMSDILTGHPKADGSLTPHLGFIGGNITPPLGDKPALLNHREVETVFHEFGHLLHHILSEVKIRSLGGTNVAWDFVELPSQIMENWCWERESLDLFARHYETGDPIPEDLFDKMKRARNFGAGRMQMRQLFLGKMDLALHLDFDPQEDDLDAFLEEQTADYQAPVTVKFPTMVRSFEHLFAGATGYASGYYSYKWAEVLDADAFTRFARDGNQNPETGMSFRKTILSRGNAEEPEELFHAFMGREPDPEALLVRLGLVSRAS